MRGQPSHYRVWAETRSRLPGFGIHGSTYIRDGFKCPNESLQFTGGFPLCLSLFWTSGTGELWCLALNTLFLSFILFHRDVPAITTYIGVKLDLGQASLRPSTPGHTLPRCDGHLKLVEGTGLLWPQVEPGRREENSKPTKEPIVCRCLSRERLQAAPCGTDGRMGFAAAVG